jgi:hypothetical protein
MLVDGLIDEASKTAVMAILLSADNQAAGLAEYRGA